MKHKKNIMSAKLETSKLAEMLRMKRGSRGLREAAKEISKTAGPISSSTLSRIEQGNIPDITTYITICSWLEVPTNYFTESGKEEYSPQKQILAHLRADKDLPKETAIALVQMINLAYEGLGKSLPQKNVKKK